MADKELAIMRGMTGSGKSRAAAQMVARANTFNLTHTICSADDYWKTNEIPFSYSKLTAAHTYCQLLAIEAIQRGDSLIIIDNTNTRHDEYTFYIKLAQANGYHVSVYDRNPPPDSARQALECALRNTAGTPLSKAFEQYERFEYGLHPLLQIRSELPRQDRLVAHPKGTHPFETSYSSPDTQLYRYVGCCINIDGQDIDRMMGQARVVSKEEFNLNVPDGAEFFTQMYDVSLDEAAVDRFNTLTFFTSILYGTVCYFFRYSDAEFIWLYSSPLEAA